MFIQQQFNNFVPLPLKGCRFLEPCKQSIYKKTGCFLDIYNLLASELRRLESCLGSMMSAAMSVPNPSIYSSEKFATACEVFPCAIGVIQSLGINIAVCRPFIAFTVQKTFGVCHGIYLAR